MAWHIFLTVTFGVPLVGARSIRAPSFWLWHRQERKREIMRFIKTTSAIGLTFALFTLCASVYAQRTATATPTEVNVIKVYTNDFSGAIGLEWSVRPVSNTPLGQRKFLGEFGGESTTLTLTNLPPHSHLSVSFDLFVIKSWDGDVTDEGPDLFTLEADGQKMLQYSFSSHDIQARQRTQSYPAQYPTRHFPFGTGALEKNTLGYSWNSAWGAPLHNTDTVYHLVGTMQHSAGAMNLVFKALGTTGRATIVDESWGIDNINVSVFDLAHDSPPFILSQPRNESPLAGETTALTLTAASVLPVVYQWLYNEVPISGETNAFLVITNITSSFSGQYKALLSNEAGRVTSDIVSLTVRTPPSIVKQPQAQTVRIDANTFFSVDADGDLPLSYQWTFNGKALQGATNEMLLLSSVTSHDAGLYGVAISNTVGSVRSAIVSLTILQPPVIVEQPTNATGLWGMTNTLSVVADGTQPLEYQWYKNGVIITGETNSILELANLRLDSGGAYSVAVYNAFGTITSQSGVLTVSPAELSIGLYPGVMIHGVVGRTYGVEYAVDPSEATSWISLTNITLSEPLQLWIDTEANTTGTNWPKRFYKVIAIP